VIFFQDTAFPILKKKIYIYLLENNTITGDRFRLNDIVKRRKRVVLLLLRVVLIYFKKKAKKTNATVHRIIQRFYHTNGTNLALFSCT